MGCGSSTGQSTIIKQSTSPKKLPASLDLKSDKSEEKIEQKRKVETLNNKSAVAGKKEEQQHSIIEDIKFDNEEANGCISGRLSKKQLKSSVFYTYPVIEEAKIFLFGESAQQRKIVSFNMEDCKFQIVSSRSHNFQSANSKYQPSDPIFESSQELMASHLYNKFSKPPYNFMYATYISEDKLFMCGGVNGSFDYITDQSFIYRTRNSLEKSHFAPTQKGNNLLGIRFEKQQPMHRQRYSHMGAYFIMNGLGYIFVFGGRGEGEDILNHCERYSLQQKKWTQIPPMKMERSTGFSLVFTNKIYLFGGYTSEKKRTKKIEVYDPEKNFWEILDVKIHRGIEAGFIVSGKPNEILIMGGNVQLGALKSVIKVNLAQKTYNWDSNMKHQRFLQKGGKIDKDVYIFGGDFQDTIQKYSFKDRKWRQQKIQYSEFISPQDINSFTIASQTLNIKLDEAVLAGNSSQQPTSTAIISGQDFQKIHIFGNDEYPIIMQINIDKWVLKKKAVPMSLRLRCSMGITKIKEGKYLVAGGIDSYGQKSSRAAYLYYSGTNNAIQIGKINKKKYDFIICSLNEVVYIFGGKTSKNGDILNTCEKYDTNKQDAKWQQLPNLSRQRAGAKCLVSAGKILIWGGVDSIMSVSQIQMYFISPMFRFDPKTQTFSVYPRSIPMSSDIIGVTMLGKNPESQSTADQIFIFSYNDLLKQEYCHKCVLNLQEQKGTQSNESCTDLELQEVNLKITPFNFVFTQKSTLYFVTDKGIVNWQPSSQQQVSEVKVGQKQSMKPQIIINQVEMLQYPIKQFSFPC